MHALNPALVILSITGFGHDGPESRRSGYDQILQGEAGLMSLTGSGPDDPAARGRPHRGPALRDVRGVRHARGAAAARTDRPGTDRPHVAARRPDRGPRLPGHPGHGRRRGPARPRATTTRPSPPTACSTAGRAACRSAWAARSCGRRSPPPSASTPTGRSSPPTRTASATARKSSKRWSASSPTIEAEPLLAKLNDAGIPAGKVRTLDEVYEWEQVHSQGLRDRRRPQDPRQRQPARAAAAVLQRRGHRGNHAKAPHRAPPLLDQDGDQIRQWLDCTGNGRPARHGQEGR